MKSSNNADQIITTNNNSAAVIALEFSIGVSYEKVRIKLNQHVLMFLKSNDNTFSAFFRSRRNPCRGTTTMLK